MKRENLYRVLTWKTGRLNDQVVTGQWMDKITAEGDAADYRHAGLFTRIDERTENQQ